MAEGKLKMPAGKRVGPPEVPPVTIGNVRYEAIHWGKSRGLGQNGGYIAAFEAETDRELWTLKIYDIVYDPKMEEDVQDVFIETISESPRNKTLKIVDENGRKYRVDPEKRSVKKV
jgi:hypothetical protein